MAIQMDGAIVIGGDFTSVNGILRNHVARLYGALATPPVLSLGSPGLMPAGRFRFNFNGATNRAYTIQASTDLASWTVLTNLTATRSPVTFEEATAKNRAYRFYRVLRP